MEKKRKREKNPSNGFDVNMTALPQQNAEQAAPLHPWQYSVQPTTATTTTTTAQQNTTPTPPQTQDTQSTLNPKPPPYWPYTGPYFSDSTWPPPSSQVGAPPYPFPPPGTWYAPYPPPYSGYFGYPLPANPSVPKGLIKPPQGLAQKHQKLWEAQSAENVQLWGTLARVEAELAAQRTKVAQLEAELNTVKNLNTVKPTTNPEPVHENVQGSTPATTVPPPVPIAVAPPLPIQQPVKRRYRRPVIGNIPPEAIAPRPRGRKPSADKFRKIVGVSPTGSSPAGADVGNGSFGDLRPVFPAILRPPSTRENGVATRQLPANGSQQQQDEEEEDEGVLVGKLSGLDRLVDNL